MTGPGTPGDWFKTLRSETRQRQVTVPTLLPGLLPLTGAFYPRQGRLRLLRSALITALFGLVKGQFGKLVYNRNIIIVVERTERSEKNDNGKIMYKSCISNLLTQLRSLVLFCIF